MAGDVRNARLVHPIWTAVYLLLFTSIASAFYVPGYSIKSYKTDENIPLLVNKVYSDNSQLQYAYFDLPFVCPPTGNKRHGSSLMSGQSLSLNLGEVLRGDRIKNSDFEINMGQDVECAFLCERSVDRREVMRAQDLIEDGYVTEWILDNLPGATPFVTVDRKRKYYAAGFKLGFKDFDPVTAQPMYYINNHFTVVVRWRKAPGNAGDDGGKVVVGFEVYTKSIETGQRNATGCPYDPDREYPPLPLYISPNYTEPVVTYPESSYQPPQQVDLDDGATMSIPYSYSVYFREENEIEWANRWDVYFNDQEGNESTHWLAIVNSIIISSILGAVCMVIWIRTTGGEAKARSDGTIEEAKRPRRRDAKKATSGLLEKVGDLNDDDLTDDELLDDTTGWKLLHADVFRPPPYSGLLAPLIGSGMQLVFMIVGLLSLSCFGILNPSWRGGFISVGVGLFVFAGGFSGYFSGRVYKTFGGQNFRKNTLMTAFLFPGLTFSTLFILNLFTWAQASSTAIPFTTLLALLCLWLLIQVPLVHVGSYYGYYRSPPYSHPTRTSPIPRQIPPTAWYNRNYLTLSLAAGLVPFAVLFIELLFVFKSLYLDKSSYYYVFGFLTIISFLLLITIAETVIITTYIQLCAENYHWWWQSFLTGASGGVWIFVYGAWYYWTKLHVDGFVSGMLFFWYIGLSCLVFSLAGGTVGWVVGYGFVRRIFGGMKVD